MNECGNPQASIFQVVVLDLQEECHRHVWKTSWHFSCHKPKSNRISTPQPETIKADMSEALHELPSLFPVKKTKNWKECHRPLSMPAQCSAGFCAPLKGGTPEDQKRDFCRSLNHPMPRCQAGYFAFLDGWLVPQAVLLGWMVG